MFDSPNCVAFVLSSSVLGTECTCLFPPRAVVFKASDAAQGWWTDFYPSKARGSGTEAAWMSGFDTCSVSCMVSELHGSDPLDVFFSFSSPPGH